MCNLQNCVHYFSQRKQVKDGNSCPLVGYDGNVLTTVNQAGLIVIFWVAYFVWLRLKCIWEHLYCNMKILTRPPFRCSKTMTSQKL